MKVNKRLCPAGLKNNPNTPLKAIEYITIHCTGNYNKTAGAKSHADYLFGGSGGRQASWHYTVDANEIWQSFEDERQCWHAGDGNNGPGNYTSIGIEICVNDRAGFLKACDNAAWLIAELLKKHNLPLDRVVQHNRWNGKNCPKELRNGEWGVSWNDFIEVVKGYLNSEVPVSQQKFYRVQVGAYRVKANADVMLAKLKAAGFEGYIKCD